MQFLMQGHSSLLVSGCHGKTTTSALVAHLLHYCGVEPSYCIGGTVPSLERHGLWKPTDYFVAEADESDGTFLELPCDHLIITNTYIDHLDYWKDEKELKKAYTERINSVKTQNRILCAQDPFLKDHFEGIFYGWSSTLAINAQNISTTSTGMQFDLHYYGECFRKVQLPLMGKHNILNSLAAIAMCANTGVSVQKLLEALSHFRGIERRMHLIGENGGATIVDDYAHHPNEITASLDALRNHYPNHQLVVIFQPHKYSRIKENISQFKTCFSHADTLIITSIFAAGESSSEYPNLLNQLIETIDQKVTFIPFKKIQSSIDLHFQPKTIIVTMGAGDITSVGKSLTHAY